MSQQKVPIHIQIILFFAKVQVPLCLLVLSVVVAFIGFFIGRRDLMFFGVVLTLSALGFLCMAFALTVDALMVTVAEATRQTSAQEAVAKGAEESSTKEAANISQNWKFPSLWRH
jgi:Cu/Ag efflux pump CusA